MPVLTEELPGGVVPLRQAAVWMSAATLERWTPRRLEDAGLVTARDGGRRITTWRVLVAFYERCRNESAQTGGNRPGREGCVTRQRRSQEMTHAQ